VVTLDEIEANCFPEVERMLADGLGSIILTNGEFSQNAKVRAIIL